MRRAGARVTAAGALVVGMLALGGCATEDYVDKHVAVVNDRVVSLEGRVDGVDKTAQEALQRANDAAAQAATTAIRFSLTSSLP